MLSLLNWKETKACKTDADEPKKLALRDSITTSLACQMSMVLATVMHHLFFFPTDGVKSISSRCHLGSFSDYNCPRSGIITAAFCKQVFKVLTLSPLPITFLFIGKTIVDRDRKEDLMFSAEEVTTPDNHLNSIFFSWLCACLCKRAPSIWNELYANTHPSMPHKQK